MCAAALPAQVSSVLNMDEFLQDWKQAAQFTLDVAQAMPAEFYGFKPNPEEMTFAEQMIRARIAVTCVSGEPSLGCRSTAL